jgi:hypothetical protein
MSARRAAGVAVLSIPFVAIFIGATLDVGLLGAITAFAACGLIFGLIVLGTWLLDGAA